MLLHWNWVWLLTKLRTSKTVELGDVLWQKLTTAHKQMQGSLKEYIPHNLPEWGCSRYLHALTISHMIECFCTCSRQWWISWMAYLSNFLCSPRLDRCSSSRASSSCSTQLKDITAVNLACMSTGILRGPWFWLSPVPESPPSCFGDISQQSQFSLCYTTQTEKELSLTSIYCYQILWNILKIVLKSNVLPTLAVRELHSSNSARNLSLSSTCYRSSKQLITS